MKKILLILFVLLSAAGLYRYTHASGNTNGAPPYEIADDPPEMSDDIFFRYRNWKRPDGPPKVALQIGHFKNDEVPDELHRLRGNTGAVGGGKTEYEVNLAIAELTSQILKDRGIAVELLPATVPPEYWADVFVAIHADGSEDTSKTGYKAAAPRRDLTGKAENLRLMVEEEYGKATGLAYDPNVTRNMRGYYAFGWWRHTHAIHPMTTAIILETGFLTSPSDREIIVRYPDISAQGIANGILSYLASVQLLNE